MIQETFPMTVGEEEVRDERELLTRVEDDGRCRFGTLYYFALFCYSLQL